MGYSFTTSPGNAVPVFAPSTGLRRGKPGKFLVPPKTHTPGSRLEKRGLRFYFPVVGRWTARDPIGELGFIKLHSRSPHITQSELRARFMSVVASIRHAAVKARVLGRRKLASRLEFLASGIASAGVSITQDRGPFGTKAEYVFCGGDPIDKGDYLGLDDWTYFMGDGTPLNEHAAWQSVAEAYGAPTSDQIMGQIFWEENANAVKRSFVFYSSIFLGVSGVGEGVEIIVTAGSITARAWGATVTSFGFASIYQGVGAGVGVELPRGVSTVLGVGSLGVDVVKHDGFGFAIDLTNLLAEWLLPSECDASGVGK